VLAMPGITPTKWKPHITYAIADAWPKQAPDGRKYFKIKFNCLHTESGKALYAKLWARKAEPRVSDLYIDDKDLPLMVGYPFTKQTHAQIHV